VNPPQGENRNTNNNNNILNEGFFPFIPRRTPFLSFREVNTFNSDRGGIFSETGFFGRAGLRIISSNHPNLGRNSEFAPQPTINSDEIRETIAQNILEVQNIIDFGNYDDLNNENENKEINENDKKEMDDNKKKEEFNLKCFDLEKRILAKGQWVDVKDTVEQWLDAQVIEVSEDKKNVKIHYNHWSSRWDEWIPTNSPRIMPFRYHTRQTNLNNYHSPFPNKKPDYGVSLLSFEDLNKSCSVHPPTQRRIPRNQPEENPPPSNSINPNQNNEINSIGISTQTRYVEPLPPIPSPKHQVPDPQDHIIKNMGQDGFIGVFKEFDSINKVIDGLKSELLEVHDDEKIEGFTPIKLNEYQNKFYFNLKRLIPILDRAGRIYSDISTFIEHTMKTNQLSLLSKNIFSNCTSNLDLKYFTQHERMLECQNILSKNSRRENRSGTLNLVPPVNKFETKLVNSIPILDTPFMNNRNDTQISQMLDFFFQNNNSDDEQGSLEDVNNNINNSNNNNNNNRNRNNNQNTNNEIAIVSRIEIEGKKNEEENINKNKKNKKMIGKKRNRNLNGIKIKNNKSEDKKKKKK